MFEKFRKITPTELLQKGWTTHDKWTRAPNVVDMIFFCESISVWVQLEIITEKPAFRYRTYEKFIYIAKELEKINNQYGLLQMFAGLDSHCINRFKKLEKVLETSNPELAAFMKNTAKLMNTSKNFFNLRQGLWRLETPCIPYLGVFLKDAFMIDELLTKSKIGRADPEQTKPVWNIYHQINAYRQVLQARIPLYEFYRFPQLKRLAKYLKRELHFASEIDLNLLSECSKQLAKTENSTEKTKWWG
ncbi:hypothetical protein RFI_05582 [Reticulomyxa filosa]|uniref:Ras-GEF domain-containing protein n=1 Tax=Reticulomyxa filosa TaxID=46433 RepID=X6P1W1_RETFI|nr:hypothetical protein RFI_05582 [Reticulomyxa filosa]|eukprot:ETO31542.1 hypothetical protein RFI_05582 [Reticulomyxa filosa]